MYFPAVFAAGLALSNCLWAAVAHDQHCVKQRPLVKIDSVNATHLAKMTEHLISNATHNGTRSVVGHRPKHIPFSPRPEILHIKDPSFDKLASLNSNNTRLFERKQVINRQSYPWCTIGKIATYDDAGKFIHSCTGTVVGRNLMMTASHCVPWSQGSGHWSMEFIPSYNGDDPTNPEPFGIFYATQCRGVRNTDDVTGLDYVICQLTASIGDTVGYMGWESSSSNDFYLDRTWTSVGYPDDSFGGQEMMVEDGIRLDDVDDEGSDGKELESYVYSSAGWSGGPLFEMTAGGPLLGGVMSGFEEEFSFWDFFVADHTVSAGGLHMAHLIAYGRENWKP